MSDRDLHPIFAVRLPLELRRALKAYASQRGLSPSWVVRDALAEKIFGEQDEVRVALEKLTTRLTLLEQRELGGRELSAVGSPHFMANPA